MFYFFNIALSIYHISSEDTFKSLFLIENVGVSNSLSINVACTTIEPLIKPKPYAKKTFSYIFINIE